MIGLNNSSKAKMKTILCPTDFSKNATCAASYACALGEKFNSRIILFHAYESPAAFNSADFTIIQDAQSMLKESASKKLEALKKKLAG